MTAREPEEHDLGALLARLDDLSLVARRAVSARLVSVAGHLVGTPLNVIAGRAALLRSNPSPAAIEENARRIEEQVERLAQRIRRLIDYFGMPNADPAQRSVGALLQECSNLYAPIAECKGISLQVKAGGAESLRVDGAVVSLILTSLLSLGVRSARVGQRIDLAASEHGPKSVAFELGLPGLEAPPKNFERLEPPEPGLNYDVGALETLWTCLGLASRVGGSLDVVGVEPGPGVTIRLACACD